MKNKLTLRKTFNLIQIILLVATLIIIIVAPYGEYTQYNWLTKFDPNIGYYKSEIVSDYANETVINQGVYHFSDFMSDTIFAVFLLIPTVLVAICLCLSVFSVLRKSLHRDSMLHIALPFLALIFYTFFITFCIDIIGGPDYTVYSGNTPIGPVFTVYSGNTPIVPVAVVMGIVIIISFIKRSKSFNPETKVTVEVSNKSEADELKKFKELLDSGVITQEEFDAKKKELLNLQ